MGKTLPFVILLAVSGIVVAQQQVAPPAIEPWVQGGAVMALAYVVFHLLKFTLPAQQKEITQQRNDFRASLQSLNERHERWEQIRHEDSANLQKTLAELSITCAKVHALHDIGEP